jgi:hypothetical protein
VLTGLVEVCDRTGRLSDAARWRQEMEALDAAAAGGEKQR